MIVRRHDGGSMTLIRQTDHALLSGAFAAHWGNADFEAPRRRESVVRAAALHDCGWTRYEAAPRYDVATRSSPSFFQTPNDGEQLAAYGAGIQWLTEIDPYAGLLISRHRSGLWRDRYGAVKQPAMSTRGALGPDVEAFANALEDAQRAALAGLDRAAFDIEYQLLQFWDLFSLALCMDEPKTREFEFVPESYSRAFGAGVAMRMTPRGGDEIALDPYPFDRKGQTFACVFRRLPTHVYASEDEFRLAYFAAEPATRTFRFV
jgi:hypothetical protein